MHKINNHNLKYKGQYSVESDSRAGVSYTVSETFQNTWECSCPFWTRHTPRRQCKHITAVQARWHDLQNTDGQSAIIMKLPTKNRRAASDAIERAEQKAPKPAGRAALIELD